MSTHATGSWFVEVDQRMESGVFYIAGYNIVSDSGVEVVGVEGICSNETSEADARLIAAAPDLLAALQAILAGGVQRVESSLHKQALAAVTKAVGPNAESK